VPKGFEILEFSALFDILGWADEAKYNTKVTNCGLRKHVPSTFSICDMQPQVAQKQTLLGGTQPVTAV